MSDASHYEIVVRAGAMTKTGVDHVKRLAIRRCRAMTKAMGVGAEGCVRRPGFGLVYQVAAHDHDGVAVLHVEEL